jgi:hypothetical protein
LNAIFARKGKGGSMSQLSHVSEVCFHCNQTFGLGQAKVSYKGQIYHGHCFVKAKQKEAEAQLVKIKTY